MDAWFGALEGRVAEPVFGPVVAGAGSDAAAGVRSFTQTAATTSPKYEFFDDYDAFVYNVLSGRTGFGGYLGGNSATDVALAALRDAIATLRTSQGDEPTRWL